MELEKLISERILKLEKLKSQGVSTYPYNFGITHRIGEILESFAQLENKVSVRVAGRLRLIRLMGKASFADLHDQSGKIQIYLRQEEVGEKNYNIFKLLDLGDIIGVEGVPFVTRTGERTIHLKKLVLLSKSLRPLSDKWKGLKNRETRYRQRYLDLIMNPEVKQVFKTRSEMLNCIRNFLHQRGFLEVETPILQMLYGGALAKPFITHHNALNLDLYLRIADELYLKRLVVGGMERVYEVCKDFRNEGIDRIHNPEFSMIELYQAYADYDDMVKLIEEMLTDLADNILKSKSLTYLGEEIDLSLPWRKVKYYDLMEEYTGFKALEMNDEELKRALKKIDPEADFSKAHRGKLLDSVFGLKVEPHLKGPILVMDFPKELSPLTKEHREDPRLAERFELFILGKEIANAYSELNDPLEQKRRFEEQVRWKQTGDEETQPMDDDFLRAMEYGMPPMGGMGIGFDRLVMLFTNQPSIRDVILFPQLRPEEMAVLDDYEEEAENQ